jgi:hypothetical protein
MATRALPVALIAGLLLATPAAAHAHTYVDDDGGLDANPCTQAQPCLTAQRGIDAAGPGQTVFVDGGNYAEGLVLGGGKSLVELDFNAADGDTQAVIDGGGFAISVHPGQTAGRIEGLTLRGTFSALTLAGPATVVANTFDSANNGGTAVMVTDAAASPSVIGPGNVISDDGVDSEERHGVTVTAGTPTVTGNTFTALTHPIYLVGGGGTVSGNEISGTHFAPPNLGGRSIAVIGASATISGNYIHSPDGSIATALMGISIQDGVSGEPGRASLASNRVFGHSTGLAVSNATGPVTSQSDVYRDGLLGLNISGPAAVTATNITTGNNFQDIQIGSGLFTLDSSIVEDFISGGGGGTCEITFSRGSSMTPGGNGCQNFQTTEDPMFAADGYHLLGGSPMIETGNPALGAPGDLDVDLESRGIDTDGACPLDGHRDIGADEFAVPQPDCTPPVPAAAVKKRKSPKCKKKGKKRAAAAKRKCKRKKRPKRAA